MDAPYYQDEALVTLSIRPTDKSQQEQAATLPERRVLLSRTVPVIKIGRTSRRKAELEPSASNFYFDCPVMSRDHAVLQLDTENKRVNLKDSSSLHGTFVNKQKLTSTRDLREIRTGDIIEFGVTVDRGTTQYRPFFVEADVRFGTEVPKSAAVTYKVPDESEIEDISSDDDEDIDIESGPDMEYATKVLRENGIRPAKECRPPIDLTLDFEDDIRPLPPLQRADEDRRYEDFDEVPHQSSAPATTLTQGNYVDLTDSFNDTMPETLSDTGLDEEAEIASARDLRDLLDDAVDAEDAEEDDDYGEDASLPDVSVSSGDSDVSDESDQEEAVVSDNLAEGITVQSLHDTHRSPILDSEFVLQDSIHSQGVAPAEVSRLPPLNPLPGLGGPFQLSQGLMANKTEFLQARAVNKHFLGQRQVLYESPYAAVGPPTPLEPGIPVNSTTDRLMSSSLQFLNTPPPAELQTPVPAENPMLDDTSAFAFEMSKRAVKSSQQTLNDVESIEKESTDQAQSVLSLGSSELRGQAEEASKEEPHRQSTPGASTLASPPTKSLKRKSVEISRTTPEDELWGPVEPEKAQETLPVVIASVSTAPAATTLSCQASTSRQQEYARPPKRLRKAAEVFGYVALGGVAVMSALIATAPTL